MKPKKRIALVAHDERKEDLLRMSVLYNIPSAGNRSTADFMITSPLFNQEYVPKLKDYSHYIARKL